MWPSTIYSYFCFTFVICEMKVKESLCSTKSPDFTHCPLGWVCYSRSPVIHLLSLFTPLFINTVESQPLSWVMVIPSYVSNLTTDSTHSFMPYLFWAFVVYFTAIWEGAVKNSASSNTVNKFTQVHPASNDKVWAKISSPFATPVRFYIRWIFSKESLWGSCSRS